MSGCLVDICDRSAKALGYCNMHYKRLKRNGDPAIARRRRGMVRDELGRKMCVYCREWCHEEVFGRNKNNIDGLGSYCRDCRITYQRLLKFGMTEAEYTMMLIEQGSACAICRSADPGPRGWHVDHDHSCCSVPNPRKEKRTTVRTCGRCVRGLLCHACNLSLGGMRDDPTILRSAADYLERAAVTRGAR